MSEAMPSVWMYGGGRQSISIAVLIIQGRIPKPDYAIIADTGREKSTTWAYLEKWVQPAYPDTIHRIFKDDFATVDLWGGKDKDSLLIPAFTLPSGKLETFCSNEWKARVCDRWLKRVAGVKKYQPWIGFSIDEPKRWKKKKELQGDGIYFPLVETVPTTKAECAKIVTDFGWPEPIHSACWMCPLQDDFDFSNNTYEDQIKAKEFDRQLRLKDPNVFIHRSRVPYSDVVLNPARHEKEPCDSGLCML
jgi:hypothetical protein